MNSDSASLRALHVLGSTRFGGATGVVFTLVDTAREHGITVQVLSDDPDTIDACRDRGVEVFRFRGVDRPIRPLRDFAAAVRLSRALKGSFELVHTHTTKGGAIGRVAARWAGIPVVVHTVHGFAFHEFSSGLTTRIGAAVERRLARRCDKLIFVNSFDRLRAIELGIGDENSSVTIYNGVPDARLDTGRDASRAELLAEIGAPANGLLCVCVGRLAPQKGLTHLIDAMAIVKNRLPHPPVHLAIVGDGELEGQCREQIASHDLGDRVHMLGFRTDSMRWTGGGDLFVLSSLWEGHSITLLEAMGLARPIVATDIKGNRESITHEHDGLLVPAADPQTLADGIIALATDREKAERLGSAAQATFRQRFTEQAMKEASWRLYEELLREKGLL